MNKRHKSAWFVIYIFVKSPTPSSAVILISLTIMKWKDPLHYVLATKAGSENLIPVQVSDTVSLSRKPGKDQQKAGLCGWSHSVPSDSDGSTLTLHPVWFPCIQTPKGSLYTGLSQSIVGMTLVLRTFPSELVSAVLFGAGPGYPHRSLTWKSSTSFQWLGWSTTLCPKRPTIFLFSAIHRCVRPVEMEPKTFWLMTAPHTTLEPSLSASLHLLLYYLHHHPAYSKSLLHKQGPLSLRDTQISTPQQTTNASKTKYSQPWVTEWQWC